MEICREHSSEGIAFPYRDRDCPACSEIDDLRNEISDLESQVTDLNSDVDDYKNAIDERDSTIEELEEELQVPLSSIVGRTIHGNPE